VPIVRVLMPTIISGIPLNVVAISAGKDHSLALLSNGTVYVFGSNAMNQLGIPEIMWNTPPIVQNLLIGVIVTNISAGYYTSIFATTNGIYVTGYNNVGQLGLDNIATVVVPTAIVDLQIKAVKYIEAGQERSFVIVIDAKDRPLVYGSGRNDYASIGMGFRQTRGTIPLGRWLLLTSLIGVESAMISSGLQHTILLSQGGTLFSFGDDSNGQLGLGSNPRTYSPVQFSSLEVLYICSGAEHTVFIDRTGGVYSFGANDVGQLGVGATTSQNTPTKVNIQATNVTNVYLKCGAFHTLMLRNSGLLVWGVNKYGQLMTSDTLTRMGPNRALKNQKFTQIAAGDAMSLALDEQGSVWFAGITHQESLTQFPVPTVIIQEIQAIVSTDRYFFLLAINGTTYGMGYAPFGQFCIGGNMLQLELPTALPPLQNSAKFYLGTNRAYFQHMNGTAFGCGDNSMNQIAISSSSRFTSPRLVELPSPEDIAGILVSASDVLWITSSGSVYGIGSNKDGMLGTGDTMPISTWSRIVPFKGYNVIKMSIGWRFTISVIHNYCFGKSYLSSDVCSHHGTCLRQDTCNCISNWFGMNCEVTSCGGINSTSQEVCSSSGTCIGPDQCICKPGYSGNRCQDVYCNVIPAQNATVCNGRGQCIGEMHANAMMHTVDQIVMNGCVDLI
jgi:alpha-tubulin suppressor-like RCC1 family protein